MIPDILHGLPIDWQGVDDNTPDGCEFIATTVLGIHTTYIVRDGEVLGRFESNSSSMNGYVGDRLKGGRWVGSGLIADLAKMIVKMSAR